VGPYRIKEKNTRYMKPMFRMSPRTCGTGTASVSRYSCKDSEEHSTVVKGEGVCCLAVDGTLPAKVRKLHSLDTFLVLALLHIKPKTDGCFNTSRNAWSPNKCGC